MTKRWSFWGFKQRSSLDLETNKKWRKKQQTPDVFFFNTKKIQVIFQKLGGKKWEDDFRCFLLSYNTFGTWWFLVSTPLKKMRPSKWESWLHLPQVFGVKRKKKWLGHHPGDSSRDPFGMVKTWRFCSMISCDLQLGDEKVTDWITCSFSSPIYPSNGLLYPLKPPPTSWFKVTFWSPSWRSLSPLKGSLNHPKKVTLNHQVAFFKHLVFFFATSLAFLWKPMLQWSHGFVGKTPTGKSGWNHGNLRCPAPPKLPPPKEITAFLRSY